MPKCKIADKTVQFGIRLDGDQIAILDRIVVEMREKTPGINTSRADVARHLMYLGLVEFEKNPKLFFENK
jgi:hypothetical protein